MKTATKTPEMVPYLDRWVEKKTFRVFVYGENGQKLANSWEEFQELVASGLWSATPDTEKIEQKPMKKGKKNGANGKAVC